MALLTDDQIRRLVEMEDRDAEMMEMMADFAAAYALTAVKQERRVWTKDWIRRRGELGQYNRLMVELRHEDVPSFVNFMRMTPDMFDEILERILPRITKMTTVMREPLEPGLKLAVTLRHLAAGDKYASQMFGWRVPRSTQTKLVVEVCQAIVDEYQEELMSPPVTPEAWREIADGFYKRWQVPHCLGAIDGKHVRIRQPAHSGSTYHNYKHFYSIVMLAMVDSNYKFIWADIGGRGAASDAQIWNACEMNQIREAGELGVPPPDYLPHDNVDKVPYFWVGDDAFALKDSMMKPFKGSDLTIGEIVFNYRLCRARRIVENAFGILANRFQILLGTMMQMPSTCRLIVKTCMLLHNLMRDRYPGLQNQLIDVEDNDHLIIPGRWRVGRNMLDIEQANAPNIDTKKGKKLRLLLKHWFSSEVGEVEWQWARVTPERFFM